ncbi:MAG: DUF5658 family protein [Armatimonadota bacterium]
MAATVHECPSSGGRIYLSTAVLLTVGLIDLVSTLMWLGLVHHEGNPLFRSLLAFGPSGMILGKAVFLLGPVALLEFARTKRPLSAEQGTWLAAAAYLALWLTQIARVSATLNHS